MPGMAGGTGMHGAIAYFASILFVIAFSVAMIIADQIGVLRDQALARGYAEICLSNNVWAWKGECK